MRALRDLLTTWENWSARDQLVHILASTPTDEQRAILQPTLEDMAQVDALDALHDAAELVALLSGWQWQAIHAARVAGASWEQVGQAIGTTSDSARASFVEALDRQDNIRPGTTDRYREAL